MASSVDGIVKALNKMVKRLEEHHLWRFAEMARIQALMQKNREEHQQHEAEAQRAKNIAENLKKLLGSAEQPKG